MDWSTKELNKKDAGKLFESEGWIKTISNPDCGDDLIDLRNQLVDHWKSINQDLQMKNSNEMEKIRYFQDIYFGIGLYTELQKNDFRLWEAANTNIWRYLAMNLIPDIIAERWPSRNAEHFYSRTWHIWPQWCWWFIYLTMQVDAMGNLDKEKTLDVLKFYSTDTIEGILSRCASGFNPSFTRQLMKKCSDAIQNNPTLKIEDFFRFVMKEHNFRSTVISPDIMGYDAYIKGLLEAAAKNQGITLQGLI